jgi:hypothetical protein
MGMLACTQVSTVRCRDEGVEMIFFPSQEIHDRLLAELAGVFIDRSLNAPHLWLVAKLPMNLIREIKVGAEVSLLAWIVEIDGDLIPAFGLRVYDDHAAPRTFFGSCRKDDEAADLRAVLAAGSFALQMHNENFLPVLSAECKFDSEHARSFIRLVPSMLCPGEAGFQLRERANNEIEAHLAGNANLAIKASCILPLTFDRVETLRVHVAGSGNISLDDRNEGRELERLTFHALEALFPFGAFHSPWIGEGKKRRELCDVLAVSRVREVESEGIFVIQNKVASAFPEGLKRKTSRRAKSIQNNIMEGIDQLEGAIKVLRVGETVYRSAYGTPLAADPPELAGHLEPLNLRERAAQIGQGIVVISDMHEAVDWQAVFLALGRVFLSTGYYCHVLDLQEIARLVMHANGRPALFEDMLLRRGQEMIKNKTALVRFHFVGGKR